ncbi:hypothetical protein L6164_001118 [Bauhinia variegata]|uniref:Uncharacterized protein n=1 Tax=Bauhinia variegata TaxID=167791 RepID=A0ACB9QB98_BAUVA|nr:hypothetical protein L6164_001118 [Bauhinia variegata]
MKTITNVQSMDTRGTISIKGDIYNYGILMLEMFTRKKPTDDMFSAGLSLKNWVTDLMPQVTEIVDSNLLQQEQLFDDIKTYTSNILELGLNCCADLPEARISRSSYKHDGCGLIIEQNQDGIYA